MKKNILFLFVGISLLFTACGSEKKTEADIASDVKAESGVVDDGRVEVPQDKKNPNIIYIEPSEVEGLFHLVELTTENCMDYFELKEIEIIDKDAFGEPTGEWCKVVYFLPKANVTPKDAVVRVVYHSHYISNEYFKDNDELCDTDEYEGDTESDYNQFRGTGGWNEVYYKEAYTFGMYAGEETYSRTTVDMTDFRVIKVAGSIETVVVPEQYWNSADETGCRFLAVMDGDNEYRLYDDTRYSVNGEMEDDFIVGVDNWPRFVGD